MVLCANITYLTICIVYQYAWLLSLHFLLLKLSSIKLLAKSQPRWQKEWIIFVVALVAIIDCPTSSCWNPDEYCEGCIYT